MIPELQVVFEYLSGQAMWWGLVVLMMSACIEYIVPPFPGDTVTLAGAVLIPNAGWPATAVFAALMAGTCIGATVDWRVGVWIADHRGGDSWLHRWLRRDSVEPRLEKLIEQFRRHGPWYLTLNRFIPAFRALFFVAAGIARLRLASVLAFGALGAALWNGALLGVGYAVGYRIEAIAFWVNRYSNVFLVLIGVVAGGYLLFKGWRLLRGDANDGRPKSDQK